MSPDWSRLAPRKFHACAVGTPVLSACSKQTAARAKSSSLKYAKPVSKFFEGDRLQAVAPVMTAIINNFLMCEHNKTY